MRTGRLLLTDFPQRQQRRISNLFAAADSYPRACSAGVAVRIGWCGDARPNPSAAAQPGLSSLRWAPGGRVLCVGRDRLFLHLFRRPAKNAEHHVSKPFGSVAPSVFGSFHEHIMGVSNAEVVAPDYVTERG